MMRDCMSPYMIYVQYGCVRSCDADVSILVRGRSRRLLFLPFSLSSDSLAPWSRAPLRRAILSTSTASLVRQIPSLSISAGRICIM